MRQRGDLNEARKVLEEGLEMYPDDIYFITQLAVVASKQGNKEEAKKLNIQVIQQEPNNLSALASLYRLAKKKEEKESYGIQIQRLLRNGHYTGGKIKGLRELVEETKQYYVDETGLDEMIKKQNSKDRINLLRKRIGQGISSEEAEQILKDLEDDQSIRATALKAEIYLIVFSNPKGAKKLVEQRSKLEGTTGSERSSLAKITEIIRRAEKGIKPRELETIR